MPIEFETLPEWIGGTLLGALISFFAYLYKSLVEWRKNIKEEKRKKMASLMEICSLVNSSYDVFKKQKELAMRLCRQIEQRIPNSLNLKDGFESFITAQYDHMNTEDRELHSIIRGYTHAMFHLNTNMALWLQKDFTYRTGSENDESKALAAILNRLESHLYLWIAKYNAWIPDNIKHSLVYLADEQYTGIEFPDIIELTINKYLIKNYAISFSFSKFNRNGS